MTTAIKALIQETEQQKSLTAELNMKLAQNTEATKRTEVQNNLLLILGVFLTS